MEARDKMGLKACGRVVGSDDKWYLLGLLVGIWFNND